MTGHRSFDVLRAAMSPERRARNREATDALSDELTLNELRLKRKHSQADVAGVLDVLQPAVAKLERRGDMHVSSLRRYVEALGGTLVVTARFPEENVTLRLGGSTDGDGPSAGG